MGKEIVVNSLEEMCDLMCGGIEEDDMGVMDKLDLFLKQVEEAGIKLREGQTAIVCNDAVVVIDIDAGGQACGLNVLTDVEYVECALNITEEDVAEFEMVAGIEVQED